MSRGIRRVKRVIAPVEVGRSQTSTSRRTPDVVTPNDNDNDTPSRIAEQLNWLDEIGWSPRRLGLVQEAKPGYGRLKTG